MPRSGARHRNQELEGAWLHAHYTPQAATRSTLVQLANNALRKLDNGHAVSKSGPRPLNTGTGEIDTNLLDGRIWTAGYNSIESNRGARCLCTIRARAAAHFLHALGCSPQISCCVAAFLLRQRYSSNIQ